MVRKWRAYMQRLLGGTLKQKEGGGTMADGATWAGKWGEGRAGWEVMWSQIRDEYWASAHHPTPDQVPLLIYHLLFLKFPIPFSPCPPICLAPPFHLFTPLFHLFALSSLYTLSLDAGSPPKTWIIPLSPSTLLGPLISS